MFSWKSFQIVFIVAIIAIAVGVDAADAKKQDPKCLLPKETGPCRMKLSRFYYNAQTDTCEEFIFGGCRGNDNKFGFKETCEEACKLATSATTTTTTEGNEDPMPIALQLKPSTLKSLTYSVAITIKPDTTVTLEPTKKPQVLRGKN